MPVFRGITGTITITVIDTVDMFVDSQMNNKIVFPVVPNKIVSF